MVVLRVFQSSCCKTPADALRVPSYLPTKILFSVQVQGSTENQVLVGLGLQVSELFHVETTVNTDLSGVCKTQQHAAR